MIDLIIMSLKNYLKEKRLSDAIQSTLCTMNKYNYTTRNHIARLYDTEVVEKFLHILQRSLNRNETLMLNILSKELNRHIINTKRYFNIPRPFVVIPTLVYIPIIGPESPSFPSGHAAGYRLLQLFFNSIDPNNKKIYKSIMLNGANSRIIGGVHTPTDIEGGFIVADIVFSKNN